MPSFTFTVNNDGTTDLKIEGVKGEDCKPIHDALSKDLSKILGIIELSVTDTPEAKERPLTTTAVGFNRAR